MTLWGRRHLPPLVSARPDFSSRPESKLKLNSSLICARSMSALWSVVNQKCPEMQDSVQDGRCGRRDVERVDLPAERQRDELVAGLANTRAQAAAFRTEHDHDLPAIVRPVVRDRVRRARAVHPGS